MKIAELFASLQGEGLLTGTPSLFVRTSGCNLRCWFCDTPYTSWEPEGEERSVDEILDWAADRPERHAVITGGEPMLFSEIVELSARLRESGRHVTIETAGTLDQPVACDLMSISPKLSNSTPSADRDPHWSRAHESRRMVPTVLRRLVAEYAYQLKFVVDSPADCEEVERFLEGLPEVDRDRVLLMPQGIDVETLARTTEWLAPYCDRAGLKFCPRRQIEWFGFVRGT